MTDLRQTEKYAEYMKATGWMVEKNPDFFAYCKKIPILGNFIKIQRPKKLTELQIKKTINKYKPFQLVIEPKNKNQEILIKKLHFRQSKTYFVPSKTIKINLSKTKEQLLSSMHYKTRYNIRKAQRSDLKIVTEKHIVKFADFWQKCALQQRGMYLSQKTEIVQIYNAFGKDAKIITVQKNKNIASGILMICAAKTAYYMYAASTPEGKKEFAPTLNVWSALQRAKRLKCKSFDFEGIYDKRFPINSWIGFTRFKRSFGGKEVSHPGTFSKFLIPFLI